MIHLYLSRSSSGYLMTLVSKPVSSKRTIRNRIVSSCKSSDSPVEKLPPGLLYPPNSKSSLPYPVNGICNWTKTSGCHPEQPSHREPLFALYSQHRAEKSIWAEYFRWFLAMITSLLAHCECKLFAGRAVISAEFRRHLTHNAGVIYGNHRKW